MLLKLKFILLTNIVLILTPSFGQFKFEPLKIDFGSSLVHDIYRDNNNFLWIVNGSVGLMKHNSYSTVRYVNFKDDTLSISDNRILDVIQDNDDNIWVATRKGLNRYLPEFDGFERYFYTPQDSNTVCNDAINALYVDNNGVLWVLTYHGISQ